MEKQQETRPAVILKGVDATEKDIQIVREFPLTVYLNTQELITLVTTGDANRELALGFLLSEGFLTDKEDLVSIDIDDEAGTADVKVSGDLSLVEDLWKKRTVTSGCGKGATFYSLLDSLQSKSLDSDLKLAPKQIYSLMAELNKMSELYKFTRGVHNSALADSDRIIIFRDDIGRHNAVDKIRGAAFLEDIVLHDKVLITTGRLTSEIVIKVTKMGVPIVVSRSAPTTLALDLAERVNLTLVGYVRGERMTVYTGKDKIKI